MNYWLFKSEPDCFSIEMLAKRPKQTEHWDGVRNFKVRNMLRDDIKKGDLGFFYHSSCKPPGIAGIIEVVKNGYPDITAQDIHSDHFDPRATAEKPLWYMVDVKFVKKFKTLVTLEELKAHSQLQTMTVVQRGNRLSITPVSAKEWQVILDLAAAKTTLT